MYAVDSRPFAVAFIPKEFLAQVIKRRHITRRFQVPLERINREIPLRVIGQLCAEIARRLIQVHCHAFKTALIDALGNAFADISVSVNKARFEVQQQLILRGFDLH
ncbi:hypothetical protein BSIN_4039 [Burkholderia singularis]|uniref:Uncharacterized protein n=1 Tax=Burkholderia singularis TaxID=1503053 RepID=A0A238H7K3_9BURK|nr:hypothetical protein BSIN_4039 [Burkholderia singularis]